jgi:hypothetical protein
MELLSFRVIDGSGIEIKRHDIALDREVAWNLVA